MRQVKYVSGFGELGVSRHHRDQSKFLLLVPFFFVVYTSINNER